MKTRYGVSPWVHLFPDSRRPDYPRLRGEHAVDLVIVGGGLAGCAIAYMCSVAGVKTILLEANRVGQGAAGSSAGLLLPEPGPMFADLARAHGLRAARRVFEAWRRASLDAAALVRRLRLRVGIEPVAALTVGLGGGEKLLRREFESRHDAGVPAVWLTPRRVAAATGLDAGPALGQRDTFTLDPYRTCVGLAAAATSRGVRIFERSPVTKVKFTRKDAQITTADAVVRASNIVVASGTATAEYGQLRRHFRPRETYLALTEPMPAAMRKQVGTSDATLRDLWTPRRRLRWTNDHRILIAGADQDRPPERQRDAVRIQRTGQLMYELLTMYPAISGLRPEFGWELPYGDTADGLMYIGPHRNYPHHLFALGGATDSVTGAFLAARVVTRAVLGEPDKDDAVFGFTR